MKSTVNITCRKTLIENVLKKNFYSNIIHFLSSKIFNFLKKSKY